MGQLHLQRLHKRYGAQEVIAGVDLEVHDGEFLVLVGPSGCGKSTLLRMIAGLEDISDGDLLIDGRRVNEVHPAERGAAMVFQSYALYPHMTVAENMGFALRMAGVDRAQREQQVRQAAEILKITDLLHRYPKQLSGGQRQRVAIGRAIVRQPTVFLFDEPLSNLDAALRTDMRIELARLHQQLGTTMVYVTHDQVEAMTLGDRIAVMNRGRIEQLGRPMDLYNQPHNIFVAGFLGTPKINLLRRPTPEASTAHQHLWGVLTQGAAHPSRAVTAGIRPEHLGVLASGDGVPATVVMAEHLGDSSILHLRVDGVQELLHARVNADSSTFSTDGIVRLAPQVGHAMLFDENELRIH